jgi:hypothetical protein
MESKSITRFNNLKPATGNLYCIQIVTGCQFLVAGVLRTKIKTLLQVAGFWLLDFYV